jgi:hypothetical protein
MLPSLRLKLKKEALVISCYFYTVKYPEDSTVNRNHCGNIRSHTGSFIFQPRYDN